MISRAPGNIKNEMSGSAVLSRIISRNKDTEVGKKWNLSSIKTTEDYRNNVPLTDYEDYRPYIERMVEKGEENLLSPDKVTYITAQQVVLPTKASYFPNSFHQVVMYQHWISIKPFCYVLHIKAKAHHLEYPSSLVSMLTFRSL